MNTIGIIGSGAGCIAILKSLYKHGASDLNVYIFSEDHAQVGYAYKEAPDFFIMNTRLDSLTQFDEIISLQKWLQCNNYFFSSEDYIPRSVYGKYLHDVKGKLFTQLENNACVIKLIEKADYIDNAGKIVANGTRYNVDTTVVSIGFGSDLLNDRLFSAIQSCDSSRPIKIYGSGLTAIDLILYTHSVHPHSSIECVSYSGRFPRVRSEFKSGEGSLFEGFQLGNLGLSDIIRNFNALLKNDVEKSIIHDKNFSLIDEIRYCESTIPEWQKVIYSSTTDYCKVYQSLQKKEQKSIQKMKAKIIENRAMFPLKNARKIWRLIDNKQLKISKGCYSGGPSNGNEFLAFNTTKTTPFLTLSKLPKHDIAGVDVDSNCKVIDSRNIYCLGPLTNGSRFFTEATSLTVRDASIIVDNILM